MTTRKPQPDKQPRPLPVTEKPAHKTSQADAAHIATAGYRRDQQAAVDRIAKLKAARLAQAKTDPPKPKPKPKPQKKAASLLDRPRAARHRRWGG